MKTKLTSMLLLVGLCATAAANADVTVIVNPKSSLGTMTATQVSAVFLGNAAVLANGKAPKLLDHAGQIQEEFYQKVVGRKVPQVKATWARLVFTGKAIPPTELANAAEVKKFVAQNPDAIGYIASSELDDSVKAVLQVH